MRFVSITNRANLSELKVHLTITKSGKPRSLPLTQEAIDALAAMPRTGKTEYVYYHIHRGKFVRWSEAKGPWERARDEAGYPWLRIHDLRHAYAIRFTEAGITMEIISEMLGHHSVDFTNKVYAKYAPIWAGGRFWRLWKEEGKEQRKKRETIS